MGNIYSQDEHAILRVYLIGMTRGSHFEIKRTCYNHITQGGYSKL